MPVRIPPPPENNTSSSAKQDSNYLLNRYSYYKVPVGLGSPSGHSDYDYFVDLGIASGKYAISKKNNYQLPSTHKAFSELKDSDGIPGVVSTRLLEGVIFYYGGQFNNYATKCRSDSYLADIEHIEAAPISEEEKEKYIQERPRIKGLWIQPLRASNDFSDEYNLVTYYEPYGLNRADMTLPSGRLIPARQGIPCRECGLCFRKASNDEFDEFRGRAEYLLYVLATRVGSTELKQPFPVRIVLTSSAFPSVHNLLYTVSTADPTKDINDHLVRLTLRPIVGKSGQLLPNCFAVVGEIIGEPSKQQLALIEEIVELNQYKPNEDNNKNPAQVVKTQPQTQKASKKSSTSDEDDFAF